jgi:excinuclease UvrABC ATPase subunit
VVIDQSPLGRNPRSTLGTITDIYSYVRLLFSRMGTPSLDAADFSYNTPKGACEACAGLGTGYEPLLDQLFDFERSLADGAIQHRKWKVGGRYWNIIRTIGLFDFEKPLKQFSAEEINALLYAEPRSYQTRAPGFIQDFKFEGIATRLIRKKGDRRGLDSRYDEAFFAVGPCPVCKGSRLNARARAVRLNGLSILAVLSMEVSDLHELIDELDGAVANEAKPLLLKRLRNLVDLGLGYLTLNRSISTLSGGEAQRVKLARQLGSSLTELIYIMDEPTLGLHMRDVDNLIRVFKGLVSRSNTVLTVEHNRLVMLAADHIVDIGPKAGIQGGEIVGQGSLEEIMRRGTPTGRFLSGVERIERRPIARNDAYFEIVGARRNNLRDLNVRIPKGILVSITGVSGSGKSSLMEELIAAYPRVVLIDQSPIGKNPRGTAATYCGAFDEIRALFASQNNVSVSLFSFNSDGACSECKGLGHVTMDMHFLGDLREPCGACKGRRYREDVLSYRYKGKHISEVLELTADQAYALFCDSPRVTKCLRMLIDVGLDYLTLGQPLSTLSGGENQRLKLAAYLSKRGRAYVLDEPTKGLHFHDIEVLLTTISALVQRKNSVIVVEHNMEIIRNSDWVIDLGPEGGKEGGQLLFEGTPAELSVQSSYTGSYLKSYAGLLSSGATAGRGCEN